MSDIAAAVRTKSKLALRCVAAILIVGGSLSSAHSQSNVTYEYDDLGRLVRSVYGNGGLREYHYDAAGNRRSVFTLVAGAGTSDTVGVTAADGAMIAVYTPSGPIMVTVPTSGS